MSRIGRAPVPIPLGVTLTVVGQTVAVEGPKGRLAVTLPDVLLAGVDGGQVKVARTGDEKAVKALHGLHRALIANMVAGVSTGFSRELEIIGVGYRAGIQGKHLSLHVGFSHPVLLEVPEGLTVEVPKPTIVAIKGADKQLVGQFAAHIRRIAPPEPYKGKGIRYLGEVIRRKAGKAATGAGAKST